MQSASPNGRRDLAILVLFAIAAVALIALLRVPGVIIVLAVMIAAALYLVRSSSKPETASIRRSLGLSAEAIAGVLEDYERFASSPDADHLADRTLHRPDLLNPDSEEPAIAGFHERRSSAERYLRRLEHHLQTPELTVRELDSLLHTTDERAGELEQSWWDARRAAGRLGPGQ